MRDEKTLLYTAQHEWAACNEDKTQVTVGISQHAQESLGDVIFVSLPRLGQTVKQNEAVASVESVKATSDVYAPVSGKVIAVNETLNQTPEALNHQPYQSWIFTLAISQPDELESLLSFETYQTLI